jgi:hypothetical protein
LARGNVVVAEAAALKTAFGSCSFHRNQSFHLGEEEVMYRKAAAVLCAVVLIGVGVGASVALGGEVKGPPGKTTVTTRTNPTGAPSHSSSVCSYNGLNDMNPNQGQVTTQTQTPHNQGSPGDAGAGPNGSGVPGQPTCGKDSNPEPH